MLYKSEYLKVESDVRSVPLGEKRKRGRPKKAINCLVRSPVRNVIQESVTEILENESDVVLQIINPKRGRETMLTMMMRLIIHLHLYLCFLWFSCPEKSEKAWYCSLKATKEDTKNLSFGLSDFSTWSISTFSTWSTSRLPPAITCKKSKKMCNHEVAFGKHYDKKLWSEYAKNVNSQKSTTQIDPTYNV